MTDNQEHRARERAIVSKLIDELVARGWRPVGVEYGAHDRNTTTNKVAMLEAVFNVDDEVFILFDKPGSPGKHWAQLVPGNGVDIIADYSLPNGYEREIDAAYEAVNNFADALLHGAGA